MVGIKVTKAPVTKTVIKEWVSWIQISAQHSSFWMSFAGLTTDGLLQVLFLLPCACIHLCVVKKNPMCIGLNDCKASASSECWYTYI